jgi:peptidoglycan/xylan/chitin deacetylase (PgdA/CDA1 family)
VLASAAATVPFDPPPRESGSVEEVFFGDTTRRRIALTFDDGPSLENTPRILDVLRGEGVYATFFVLGHRVDRMPELVRRIDADGHEVGNHTWSHPSMRSLWKSQIEDELDSTSDAIERALGRRPAWVRPPFGRYAPSALELFEELDLDVVLWSVDSLDWEEEDPEVIARTVVREASPGAIVLLHDRTSVTVHALPAIIHGLRDRGFEIVPVSTLTGLTPYQPLEGDHAASGDRR